MSRAKGQTSHDAKPLAAAYRDSDASVCGGVDQGQLPGPSGRVGSGRVPAIHDGCGEGCASRAGFAGSAAAVDVGSHNGRMIGSTSFALAKDGRASPLPTHLSRTSLPPSSRATIATCSRLT